MEQFKTTGLILILGLFMLGCIALLDINKQEQEQITIATDSVGYYREVARVYKKRYEKAILDPAVRLKMVAGIPEDEAITWKQKVIHDIDTKAITRWRPDSLHHYYDEETGTWNKPDSFK